MAVVLAVDAGTTGVRTLAFDENGTLLDSAYRELTQHYPQPGWVEHDATEIWAHVASTLSEVAQRQREAGRSVAAIGVTNQRETLVAWQSSTGEPVHRAIVWQDRRSAALCDRLRERGPRGLRESPDRARPRPLLHCHQDGVADLRGLTTPSRSRVTSSWPPSTPGSSGT